MRLTIGAASAGLALALLLAGGASLVREAAGGRSGEAAAGDMPSAEGKGVRLCLGPARVTLGGEPLAKLALGGEGCRLTAADLVGFGALRLTPPITPPL